MDTSGRGATRRKRMPSWQVGGHISGLPSMLTSGLFSDLTVRLADGTMLQAHRVLLAAASEVLKTKFSGSFCDSSDTVWSPEVGSVRAWQWLFGWMYGSVEILPLDLFIEMLILADHFQINALVEQIQSLPRENVTPELGIQVLHAWALPSVVSDIAKECVPSVLIDRSVLAELRRANLPNVALFVSSLTLTFGDDYLTLLGTSLRRTNADRLSFPSMFYDVVPWHKFPAEILQAGLTGDVKHFERGLGASMPFSDYLKGLLVTALVLRCKKLEEGTTPVPSLPFTIQTPPGDAYQGILAKLASFDATQVVVKLSSSHQSNPKNDPLALLTLRAKSFGTMDQSAQHEPWIEIRAESLAIKPHGIGLTHGWKGSDFCRTYVVEATLDNGPWVTLIKAEDTPLSKASSVFDISAVDVAQQKYFNRFRIRMTGPTDINTWYLMVAWFDIFGVAHSRLRVVQEHCLGP